MYDVLCMIVISTWCVKVTRKYYMMQCYSGLQPIHNIGRRVWHGDCYSRGMKTTSYCRIRKALTDSAVDATHDMLVQELANALVDVCGPVQALVVVNQLLVKVKAQQD